ncbi:MAG: cation diffusion facilitator family transporter [Petrimonas sp.]|uniref:cation diffusion facilitator family transporter n=1 Tax=Petrimonas sp. TaxID=2023866 RepID=UPI0009612C0A|nr:cation diffusion facilitator family transporter [Petrimonas sp.]MEA4980799.1 cation diffusion facilitator family transporter [Petrimonas sp.]MEA5045206.1 cation diffusion facilitator family transporter [Petrimonas sp.]MEA5062296.1 cation diffusion facilitator family transporter [Petrimonas sp.]OJV39055.1 MAG: cation-efflux pump [Bacteroidia bacterium 43-41]
MKTRSLKKFMYLSIAAAVVTIGLKFIAYLKTGSMGFFSDALESLVNLFAAIIALILLNISEKPADEGHEYGHGKAEYFSSAIEGALILIAAFSIIYTSIPRIINPQPLENLGIGTLFSVGASLVNLFVGLVLIQNGKKERSIVLEADGKHLMTDVWTSVGVIAGVLVVKFTGLLILDPIIAIVVALNIVYTGYRLISRSASGLMDASIPQEEIKQITDYLNSLKRKNIDFHSLLTRQAGYRKFISVHLLVPGNWTVKEGHDCAEVIEQRIENMFDHTVNVTTHIEPIDDPLSLNDIKIDRLNYSDDYDFDT